MFTFLDDLKNLYLKAGYIKIYDPHALEIGIRPNENVVAMSLLDIGKITGHICPGITSAYFIAKAALKALYPEGFGTRENIMIALSAFNDISLVQSLVFDAYPKYSEDNSSDGRMFLDKNLALGDNVFKFVFKRLDTGKKIAVMWDKKVAIPPEVAEKMKFYKQNKIREKYEYLDHLEWNTFINKQVEKIIIDLNLKMLTVEDATDYEFPKEMKFTLV